MAKKDGFDIHLVCQPPSSLDLNVLDRGFFNQQISQHQESPRNMFGPKATLSKKYSKTNFYNNKIAYHKYMVTCFGIFQNRKQFHIKWDGASTS